MGSHRTYRERRYAFGQQLLILRTRVSLTQIELAAQIGVHRRSVQNWETGESYPKAETLQRLIAVLLRHHAFSADNAEVEAQTLWTHAAEDGPHALAAFDTGWFAHALALHAAPPDEIAPAQAISAVPEPVPPDAPHAIIDWGEAIAVPNLYGRDREIETLRQWLVDDHCRVISIVGLGGIGKSSLAITFAQRVLAQVDVVLFRSLQNGPSLAEVLDPIIRAISAQQATPPDQVSDKIALLVQLFRERRYLLILDNFESIMESGALTGTYRTGYAEYGILLHGLSERAHESCLLLTSREKPAELGPLEGRSTPVRALHLNGLDNPACQIILAAKDIVGSAADIGALARLYGGNPLALTLVAEPIRELFAGDVAAFLSTGDAFFNGMGKLLEQQFARSTPLEQAILYWLAIEREPVPISELLIKLGDAVAQRELLVALESLRRRMLIERGPNQPAFTLQPVLLEYVTDQLVESIYQEIVAGRPQILHSHALIQAIAKEYVRHRQERLIATPLLERLVAAYGSASALEQQFLALLASWRAQPLSAQGYGPGNVINLLRLLRGDLRGLDLAGLGIRQAHLQNVDMQDARLVETMIQDSVFTENFDILVAVAISSTGAYWAAGSKRGDMRVWAAGGLILHRMWRAHGDVIAPGALVFTPDGRMLASGSLDGTIKLWDVESGALQWSVKQTGFVYHLAISPDGNTLASLASGERSEAILWNARSGVQVQSLAHAQPVASVAWSADGRVLATSDVAGAIRLWQVEKIGNAVSEAYLQTLTGHSGPVIRIAFSPISSTLASTSWDATVRVWDGSDGRLLHTFTGHTDQAYFVAWSPDGRTLASASRDQTIRLWDTKLAICRATLQGHTADVVGLTFTPDGQTLLSGSEDGTLRVWDVGREQCMRVIQGHAVSIHDLDWSPDGTQLVSCDSDARITRWDIADGTAAQVLQGNSTIVSGVGWSPTGRTLASVELYNNIRLWDAISGAHLNELRPADPTVNFYYSLAWSPDGQRLASGTFRRGMQVFDMATQQLLWGGGAFPMFIQNVVWGADGTWLAGSGDDGIIYVWDAADGTLRQRLAAQHSMIVSVAPSPAATRLAAAGGGAAGGLSVWDIQRGEQVHSIAGQVDGLRVVAWGAGADQLVSGSADGTLRWWDVQRDTCVLLRKAHDGAVEALKRSPDGTKLASCGDDGAITLWDLHSGEHLQTLRRERPYERMNITGLSGLTEAQKATLRALGAVDPPTAG